MLVDWQDIRTAIVAGALLRTSEWAIEWLRRPKKRKRRLPSKKRNLVKPLLQEGGRFVVMSAIVLGALTYSQRSLPPPRYKDLAIRAPNLVKAVVAAPYQSKHKCLPCEPKLTQPYIQKIEALPKGAQNQEYREAVKWAIGEGLLEGLDIRQEDNGQTKLHFTITPLGEQFIKELCRIKKL